MRESQTGKALRLFEGFTGHEGAIAGKISVPAPRTLVVIGECEAIAYTATRDGATHSYEHDFRESSRPVLAVTPDGKRLYLVGGKYKFGNRGIEDC